MYLPLNEQPTMRPDMCLDSTDSKLCMEHDTLSIVLLTSSPHEQYLYELWCRKSIKAHLNIAEEVFKGKLQAYDKYGLKMLPGQESAVLCTFESLSVAHIIPLANKWKSLVGQGQTPESS